MLTKWQSKSKRVWLLFFVLGFSLTRLYAQDSATKWHYVLQPYMMFPNMDGKVGMADLPDVDVQADPGDVFSHVQIGGMLYFEAYNAKWAITSDLLYMDLKQDVDSGLLVKSGEVDAKQFTWEVAGLRKISPWFEAGIGGRLISMKSGLDLNIKTIQNGIINKNVSTTNTWLDPIIVTRIIIPTEGKFSFRFRGDLGGFGIGSDFTWQVQADAAYRFSKLFQLGLGYRALGIDYESGSGQDRFLFDMDTFGPVLKFTFNL